MDTVKIFEAHQEHIKTNIQGIGRLSIMVHVYGKPYYLPKKHFLLYRDKMPDGEDVFSAFCIEFGFQYSGKEEKTVIDGLSLICQKEFKELIRSYSDKDTKEIDYDKILDRAELHNNEGYWKIYRRVNLKNSLKQAKTSDQTDMTFDLIKKQEKFILELYEAYKESYKEYCKLNAMLCNSNKNQHNQPEEMELRVKKIPEEILNPTHGAYELLAVSA